MLKERARYYYLECDYNCSEAIVFASNDVFHLGIPKESLKLMSGFGGGMCCGKTCGAICGALAIVSQMAVCERAHATEGFKDLCGNLVQMCEGEFHSLDCDVIKEANASEEERCFRTVARVADLLEAYLADNHLVQNTDEGKKL